MKVNNLIYISDIANFYLFGISRNIQRKPTVNIGNYSCIASCDHYITTNQWFTIRICHKSFDGAARLDYHQTLFYRIICIEQYTGRTTQQHGESQCDSF